MQWLGVVSSAQAYERLRDEPKTWWCLPSTAKPGDEVLMYVAAKVKNAEGQGIAALYKLIALNPSRADDCRRFGGPFMVTTSVDIELVRWFPKPLSPREMRLDPVLSGATCVRRSFQSTCFELSTQEYARAVKWLTKNNGPAPS